MNTWIQHFKKFTDWLSKSLPVNRIAKWSAILKLNPFVKLLQFSLKKIIHHNTFNDKKSRKRIQKYAKDGFSFAENFKRRCTGEEESVCVTPIQITESKDLTFLKDFMKQDQGKMKWTICYQEGIEKGLFSRYASFSTLKMAFHRHTL